MQHKLIIIFLGMLIINTPAFSQKILMKINNITDAAGEEVRALEFQINSTVAAVGGGGGGTGKATAGDLVIKKTLGKSTNGLFSAVAKGTHIVPVIFEYYNAANVLYYKITLTDVIVGKVYWLSPECPSCIKLEHQVAFRFSSYKTEDILNGTQTTWNIGTGAVQ
jgi:type VI secretion system Hcp family effector